MIKNGNGTVQDLLAQKKIHIDGLIAHVENRSSDPAQLLFFLAESKKYPYQLQRIIDDKIDGANTFSYFDCEAVIEGFVKALRKECEFARRTIYSFPDNMGLPVMRVAFFMRGIETTTLYFICSHSPVDGQERIKVYIAYMKGGFAGFPFDSANEAMEFICHESYMTLHAMFPFELDAGAEWEALSKTMDSACDSED